MKRNQIIFHQMNVNSINSSSGIFLGINIHINTSSSSKTNNGFSVTGQHNQIKRNCTILSNDHGVEITKSY